MCPRCNKPMHRKGFYPRKGGLERRIQRFRCPGCGLTRSTQSTHYTRGEHKPHLNLLIFRLLASNMSQRRAADIVGVRAVTVARKLVRLGREARRLHALRGKATFKDTVTVAFDEMETFEHTKCKPLSIVIAVDRETYKLVSVRVASMPAKGKLAAISRKKYGPRPDHRRAALDLSLRRVKRYCPSLRELRSDKCPRYPGAVRRRFPDGVRHKLYKGRKPRPYGFGELKAGGYDPLFALNQTCAKIRDNLKSMERRTWCTTKRADRLQDRLDLYVLYHNAYKDGERRLIGL